MDPEDEKALVAADADSSLGRSPDERMALFKSLLRSVDAAWNGLGLDEDERRRRIEATSGLEPRPEPWWKDVRPEALP